MAALVFLTAFLVLVTWLIGWPLIALGLYLALAIVWLLKESLKALRLSRGLALFGDADDAFLSASILASSNSKRDLLSGLLLVAGQVGAWPTRSLLGGIGGGIVGAAFLHRGSHTENETQSIIDYFVPYSLQILAAFALQSCFMIIGFDTETQSHILFQLCIGFQVFAFVLFLSHFHLRAKFEKNFAATSLRPFVFFLLSMIGVLGAAALTRQAFGVAFQSETTALSAQKSYEMLSSILKNSGVFDVFDSMRAADDLATVWADFTNFISSIDVPRAFDMFLGLSFLSTFGRSIWTMLKFSRDDEDRTTRFVAYFQLRRFEQARRELEQFDDDQERAVPAIYLALASRDIDTLHYEIEHLPKSHLVRAFGDEHVVQHYLTLQEYGAMFSLSAQEILDTINSFAQRHDRRAVQVAVMLTMMIKSSKAVLEMAQNAEGTPAASSIRSLFSVIEKSEDPEADILEIVDSEFPVDTNIARFVVACCMIGAVANPKLKTGILKPHIDRLIEASNDHISDPSRVSDIYLAISVQAHVGQSAYSNAFRQKSAALLEFSQRAEKIMRDRRVRLPREVKKLIDAPIQ